MANPWVGEREGREWLMGLGRLCDKYYGAIYAALAELRGCDFWTADKLFCVMR